MAEFTCHSCQTQNTHTPRISHSNPCISNLQPFYCLHFQRPIHIYICMYQYSLCLLLMKTSLVDPYHFLLHFNVGVVHGVKEGVIIGGVPTQLREDNDNGDESNNANDENHEEPLPNSTRISLLAAISGPENKSKIYIYR